MALIEFRGVKKAFGKHVVFSQLDLDVLEGESITIIGGSGSGKSVMLKLLIGLLRIDAGAIRFDDQEISSLPEVALGPIRQQIGMLFQGAALFDSMSVKDNVAYGLREQRLLDEAAIDQRVRESLAQVGLGDPSVLTKWPSDLSGGMKKRVGLARAIAVRPRVLLYDEPTTGLDPINVTRINRLILQLKDQLEMTSIVVTHDMHSAFTISDRIAMIYEGSVIFTGTPEELRASNLEQVRNFIEGRAPDENAVAAHGAP